MSTTSENNKRIAKNTLLLYFRMLLIMAVTFYTSRVVLEVLGVEDYGIYNVVGGVVAMFTMLSGSLSSAISRFITFELGRDNKERLAAIFSSAVNIQVLMSLFIFVLAEIGGVWFLNSKMNIPPDRLIAANWVLQCSILTFMVNLISVPYNASITAHEHMKAFAYIGGVEVLLKLAIVFILYLPLSDSLISYSILLLVVAIIIRFIYGYYCRKHFPECRYHFIYDKKLLKEMSAFAGWNFIGVTSGILRDQGVNILLNLFCGPIINAARGISVQVSTAVNAFINNFMIALNPQITKSYAIGNRDYMMTLIYRGARYSYYLLLLLSLPIIIETDSLLSLWLVSVPEHTVSFVRLILVFAMSESLSQPLITAMFATGKIRNYQIVVGGLQMMNFPVSYLALYLGFSPEATLYIAIVISQICLFARIWMLRGMINLSVRTYISHVYLKVLLVSAFSVFLPLLLYNFWMENPLRPLWVTVVCLFSTSLIIYYVGCSHNERYFIKQRIIILKNKILRK